MQSVSPSGLHPNRLVTARALWVIDGTFERLHISTGAAGIPARIVNVFSMPVELLGQNRQSRPHVIRGKFKKAQLPIWFADGYPHLPQLLNACRPQVGEQLIDP